MNRWTKVWRRALGTLALAIGLAAFATLPSAAAGPDVLPMKTAPAKGNIFFRHPGTFAPVNAKEFVSLVNGWRQEAVKEGLASKYVPVKWENHLAQIAQVRAAEASINYDHTRLTGAKAWMSEPHASENLAFNTKNNTIREALYKWYSEKSIYKADPNDIRGGHYKNLINPELTTIGLAAFVPDNAARSDLYTSAMAFGWDLNEKGVVAPSKATMLLEGTSGKSVVGLRWKSAPNTADAGQKIIFQAIASIKADFEYNYPSGRFDADVAMGTFISSNPKVASVDNKGVVTAKSAGTTTISLTVKGTVLKADLKVNGKSSNSSETPGKPQTPPTVEQDMVKNVLKGSRLGGKDRFAVAANVSRQFFSGADMAIVVNYQAFGDAISAANLSQGKAPILFTKPGQAPESTVQELKRLQPKNVIFLGGTSSVQDAVINGLDRELPGATVERIQGADRYAVSAKTALAANLGQDIVIASGALYSDALTATPLAAQQKSPLLLVKPKSVPPAIAEALRAQKVKTITVVGGPKSVSEGVLKELEKMTGVKPKRLTGPNRYDLSATVASNIPMPKTVLFASGEVFSDALVAAPLSQKMNAPIVLVRKDRVNPKVSAFVNGAKTLENGYVLGGTNTVRPSVFNLLMNPKF